MAFDFSSRRSWLAGLALTAPFVANPLPLNSLGLVVIIPLALHVARYGFKISDLRINPIIAAVMMMAVLNVAFLISGPTPYYMHVLRDIVMALSACAIVMVVKPAERGAIIDGFLGSIMAVAVVAAVFGLIKFVLMANGVLVDAVLAYCSGDPPRGAALCGDYNFFGLLLIVGSIGFIRSISSDETFQWWKVACLALLIFALLLSGSRRSMLFAPLLLIYWGYTALAGYRSIRRAVVLATILVAAVGAGAAMPGYHLFNHETRLNTVDDSSARAMATTFTAAEGYGFGSRLDRWRLAWDMIDEKPITGHGFAYHQRFSCQFVKCEHIDYPHAPYLSAWVAGGFFGHLAVLVFYCIALSSMFMFRKTGWADGSLPVMLAALPSVLISGDTALSIPHFVIATLLAWRIWPSRALGMER